MWLVVVPHEYFGSGYTGEKERKKERERERERFNVVYEDLGSMHICIEMRAIWKGKERCSCYDYAFLGLAKKPSKVGRGSEETSRHVRAASLCTLQPWRALVSSQHHAKTPRDCVVCLSLTFSPTPSRFRLPW